MKKQKKWQNEKQKKENNIHGNLASMCMKAWSLFFKMDSHLSTDPHVVAEKKSPSSSSSFLSLSSSSSLSGFFLGRQCVLMKFCDVFGKCHPLNIFQINQSKQWCIDASSSLLGEGLHLCDPRVIERTEWAERVQWSPMVVHAFDNGFCFLNIFLVSFFKVEKDTRTSWVFCTRLCLF